MNIVFYAADKEKEHKLAHALRCSVENDGHDFKIIRTKNYTRPLDNVDVACIFGVKGPSQQFIKEHLAAGKKTMFFDKGYIQRGRHYRVAINSFHPTNYFMKENKPDDRFIKLGVSLLPYEEKEEDAPVMYAGSSQKYSTFHKLGNASNFAHEIVNEIRKYTNRPIIYRPKPSWKEAKEIPGTIFSHHPEPFKPVALQSYAMVTHGSNAAVEAIVLGTKIIVLDEHPAALLANRRIDELNKLITPSDTQRRKFISNLLYCQWTVDEYKTGEAWDHLKGVLDSED